MKVVRLENQLKPLLQEAEEVCIAVAIMTDYGFELLKDHVPDQCKVNVLIGIDLLTPVGLFKEMLVFNHPNWIVKVFRKKAFFHPKFYLVKGEMSTAFIGSGNFTKGGVYSHVELFSTINNSEIAPFEEWFQQYFSMGELLSQEFIDEYEPLFNKVVETQYEADRQIRKIKRDLQIPPEARLFDLSECDFTHQYFQFDDYNAFTGNKPYSQLPEVIEERKRVKHTLMQLHDELYPLIRQRGWDLHPHEMADHIVSSHQHGNFTSDDLGALWLHYGRGARELKQFKQTYGENQTSMYQMRIQILVHAGDISVWLRVGKNNGSIVDRTTFKERMREITYRDRFYELITQLPDVYFISINGEERMVRSFTNSENLHQFVKQDNVYQAYFIIGRLYFPDDPNISRQVVHKTFIHDFELLYPIYEHIKTTL